MDKRTKADLVKYRTKGGGTIVLDGLDFMFSPAEVTKAIRMMKAGATLMATAKSIRPHTDQHDAFHEAVLLMIHLERENKIRWAVDVINPECRVEIME